VFYIIVDCQRKNMRARIICRKIFALWILISAVGVNSRYKWLGEQDIDKWNNGRRSSFPSAWS